EGQEKLINKALTRFFTCCGIPFWVVKSPFFIDLLKNLNAVLSKCQELVTYFQNSHISGAQLRDEITNLFIKENDPQALNEKLRNYITSCEFWANIECLYKVLEPVKMAVKTVESSKVKFADVFLILIKMAITIKAIPMIKTTLERLEFRKSCIAFYNKRWAEFDTDFYLLAYFLHPKYCGKGLTCEVFQKILQKALNIWKLQGGGEISAQKLVAQIHNYDLQKPPYDSLFQDHLELPETW
ncbi:12593_t:CDS:2, partial [Racocetra fulgida]